MSGINNLGSSSPISSPYSPFDTNKQGQVTQQTQGQQENAPYFSNDAYNVTNTSQAFDKAMARFTGKPVFDTPQQNTESLKTNQTSPSLPVGVSQEEVNWALDLEKKSNSGYTATPQEMQAYKVIAEKLANAQKQTPAQQPNLQAQQPAQQTPALPAGVSQQEVQWALDLENKIKTQNYTPTQQETDVYKALSQKLMNAQQQQPVQQTQQTQQAPSLPAGVSQQDVQWALDLENKIKTQKYAPTQQETDAYNALSQKLMNSQQQAPVQQTQQTQQAPTLPAGVSQQDVQWALDLENKIKTQKYAPTQQETDAYNALSQKLMSSQQQAPVQQTQQTQAPQQVTSLPPGITEQDVKWAIDLETKVKTQNYAPTAEENAKYQDMAQKLSNAKQEGVRTGNKVSQQEVQWAMDLENKAKTQNYEPNPQEMAKYQDIANRLKTQGMSNAASENLMSNPSTQNNKDWQAWSKPFEVPRSLFQTTPRIIEVPASLRAASSKLPTYTGVNQGASLQQSGNSPTGAPSKAEVDWALQLEQKVKTGGYKATQADIAQYKNISDRLKASVGQK
ncbi:MAG: hypothetical protein AABZ74_10025 [Cyanobacteriota bacterium]